MCVHHRFDDEVKEGAHGGFTPAMMKLPQKTWIATLLEGVTDKNTGQPIFKEHAWFAYKVSGVKTQTLRESLDAVLHHLLPWDIELVIDSPSRSPRFVRKFDCFFFYSYLLIRCVTSSC
jgi:hypothetical protein